MKQKALVVSLLVTSTLMMIVLAACTSTAEAVQKEFRAVSKAVLPAIVKIDVVEVLKDKAPRNSEGRPFFDYFFDDPDGGRQNREFRQESLGSGIIVRRTDDKLYVLTNAHVIADAENISVTLDDQRVFPAVLSGKDERKDLALVVFTSTDNTIQPALLGDSDLLNVGDWVLAMGAPYGFQSTVTVGIVSALHRRGGPGGNINDFIQTDASINKGNSGGALVDVHGNVVGINTWITSQSGDSVGLGFSIPINNVKHAITDFIEVGKIRYGWLGVSIVSLDIDSAESLGVSRKEGALLAGIYHESPADKAGLRPGDLVLSMNGKKVINSDELIQFVGELTLNEQPALVVQRGAQRITITPTIGLRADDEDLSKLSESLWPGFGVYPLVQSLRRDTSIPADTTGLVVRQLVSQSRIAKTGLKNRDIITSIDGVTVGSLQDFYRIINTMSQNTVLVLSVLRDGKKLTFELRLQTQKTQDAS